MKGQPITGLVLVIIAIPLMIWDLSHAPIPLTVDYASAISFLLTVLGTTMIVLPDLKSLRLAPRPRPSPPRTGHVATDAQEEIQEEASESCAECGKPVPHGVAYCVECAAKRG